MEVRLFPIEDVTVPDEGRGAEYRKLIGDLAEELGNGKTVVVHCRGGLGRVGLTAACVLVECGFRPDDAISQVRTYRPGAIETNRQEQYVRDYFAPAAA